MSTLKGLSHKIDGSFVEMHRLDIYSGPKWGSRQAFTFFRCPCFGKKIFLYFFRLLIPRKIISRPQSQFPHSCVCEWFMNSHDRSAYSDSGKSVDRSWEYKNRSQTHECGNWDWGCAMPFLGIHKRGFLCCALHHVIRLYLVYISCLLFVKATGPNLLLAGKVANSTPPFLIIDQSYAAWHRFDYLRVWKRIHAG